MDKDQTLSVGHYLGGLALTVAGVPAAAILTAVMLAVIYTLLKDWVNDGNV